MAHLHRRRPGQTRYETGSAVVKSAGFLRDPADRGTIFALLSCSARFGGMRRETIGGTAVTRYEGSLALGAATAADPTLRCLSAQAARSVSWMLWVDRGGLPRRLVLAADTAPYGHMIIDETFSGWGVPAAVRASAPITDGNHTGAESPARLTLHPGVRRAAAAVRQPERPVWPTGDPGTGADGLCGHLCAGGVRVDLGAADRGPGVDGCRRGAYLPGHAGADQQHLPRPGRPGPGHRDLGTR